MAKKSSTKGPLDVFSEYLQALVFAFFMAVIIRSFGFEPFKIPSPSMVPTLLVGDHIFVKRYAYGLRVPLTKIWLAEFGDPKRGDVVVFTEPLKEQDDYIKRVVGLPGDKITMKANVLSINGIEAEYHDLKVGLRKIDNSCELQESPETPYQVPADFQPFPYYAGHDEYRKVLEKLPGSNEGYIIQQKLFTTRTTDFEYIVPERHYFVMGDNRDNSSDSRFIGPIPRENLKGKAIKIWLSLNSEGGSCPYDSLYGWFGPLVDTVFGVIGIEPFGGMNPAPSIRWDRFFRDIQ